MKYVLFKDVELMVNSYQEWAHRWKLHIWDVKSWTGGVCWSLNFFNSCTFYGVWEDLFLLHTLHYLIERDWCWRRWRRLGNNGSTWWGLRRLTRMSANPCSWTWGWVCNDKAATLTNARLSSSLWYLQPSVELHVFLQTKTSVKLLNFFWQKPSAT